MRDRRLSRVTAVFGVAVAWLVTRAWVYLHLGYQRGDKVDFQDVNVFSTWTDLITSTHALPTDSTWQYPPGAVGIFVLPAAIHTPHAHAYVALFALCDLAALVALLIAERHRPLRGTWVWVVGLPLLSTLIVLRFDVVPTMIAMIALLLVMANRSSTLVGVIVGIGTAVKVWPVLVVLAVTRRTSAIRVVAVVAGVFLVAAVVVQVAFGGALSFLSHQAHRGLELEAVGATPWYVLQAVFGVPVVWSARNGSLELISAKADAVAEILHVTMIVVALVIAAVWVLALERGHRTTVRVARFGTDLVFVALLVYVVLSPVLSPQYFIWLVGVGAVVVTNPGTRMLRPVALMLASTGLTTALLATWGDLVTNGESGAYFLIARNAVLVLAMLDGILRLVPDVATMLRSWTRRRGAVDRSTPSSPDEVPAAPATPVALAEVSALD